LGDGAYAARTQCSWGNIEALRNRGIEVSGYRGVGESEVWGHRRYRGMRRDSLLRVNVLLVIATSVLHLAAMGPFVIWH